MEGQNTSLKELIGTTNESTSANKAAEVSTQSLADKYDQSSKALEASAKQRQTEIATSIAEGLITEEEGRQQSLAAEKNYLDERIKLNQQKLAALKEVQANSSSAEEVAKAGEQILQLEGQIADDRLAIAQAGADARKEAEKAAADERVRIEQEALDKLEAASKQADQAIAASQANRITAIKQSQLEGVVSAQDAENQIQAIQTNAIAQTIAARQNELNQVQALRQAGTISAEEATSREGELVGQIAGLRQQAVEAEIAAQQKLREEYFKTLELQAQTAAQAAQGKLDVAGSSLQAELDLLNAGVALEESRRDLAVERLNTQKAIAEAAGDENKVSRINQQITETQQRSEEAIFDQKERQLELTQKLKDIELQRQTIAAELAVQEAQIALEKARAEGASTAELQSLQTILNLREQQVGQLQNQVKVQQQLNQFEREQLSNQRAISQERQKQTAIQARAAQQEAAAAQGGLTSRGGSSGGAGGGSGRTPETVFRSEGNLQSSLQQQALKASTGSTTSLLGQVNLGGNQFLGGLLQSQGRDDILKLSELSKTGGFEGKLQAQQIAQAIDSGRIGSREVSAKLDQLIAVTRQSNSRPNLSISSVDDIGMAGRIYSDISRSNMRGAGL